MLKYYEVIYLQTEDEQQTVKLPLTRTLHYITHTHTYTSSNIYKSTI